MYAAANIVLNQGEKSRFPLPDLIRAQAPSSDGCSCPALISTLTTGPCRKRCHLTLSAKHQEFLLASVGLESSHLPSMQDWPPASHSNTPNWARKLKMEFRFLSTAFNSVTLTGIPLPSLGLGWCKSQQNSGSRLGDKELYQRGLMVKFWKKLKQHNLH